MLAALHRRPGKGSRAAWLAVAALLGLSAMGAAQAVTASGSENGEPGLLAEVIAYEHGEGVPKDPLKAAALYCDAARGGDPEAMFGLGWMYANGRGVARDDAAGAALFARAARLGYEYAQRMLDVVGEVPQLVAPCLPEPERQQVIVAVELPPLAFATVSSERKKVGDLVRRLAPLYSVQPRLALAIVAAESNFEPAARCS